PERPRAAHLLVSEQPTAHPILPRKVTSSSLSQSFQATLTVCIEAGPPAVPSGRPRSAAVLAIISSLRFRLSVLLPPLLACPPPCAGRPPPRRGQQTERDKQIAALEKQLAALEKPLAELKKPAAGAAPRPLRLSDARTWRRIGSTALSRDGQWFAYRVGPAEG